MCLRLDLAATRKAKERLKKKQTNGYTVFKHVNLTPFGIRSGIRSNYFIPYHNISTRRSARLTKIELDTNKLHLGFHSFLTSKVAENQFNTNTYKTITIGIATVSITDDCKEAVIPVTVGSSDLVACGTWDNGKIKNEVHTCVHLDGEVWRVLTKIAMSDDPEKALAVYIKSTTKKKNK